MSLKGTLKDFGIAEILQLIGQQGNSGILKLRDGTDEVAITFLMGSVVNAEPASRTGYELLGERLVRSQLITKEILMAALDLQRRTLKRLGDILVEHRYISKEQIATVVGLQLMETIYSVFEWKSGTYEFQPVEKVEFDENFVQPMNVETVLTEGFRQVDEWPLIRKRVPSSETLFARTKAIAPTENSDSFGGNERRVLALAAEGRPAHEIVDRSLLGDFEAHRIMQRLVDGGYLTARRHPTTKATTKRRKSAFAATVHAFVATAAKVLFCLALVGIGFYLIRGADLDPSSLFREQPVVTASSAQNFVGKGQLQRLRAALELHRVERGCYPILLAELVERRIVLADELRYPWSTPYHYERADCQTFVLYPPPY